MPEFYDDGTCRLQLRAQPYLAAIAHGVKEKATSRAFLLQETEYAQAYVGAEPLWQEQWERRDPTDKNVCPFWSNYFYPTPCPSCNCRILGSVPMEIDALFFLRKEKTTLAVHIEMKCDREPQRIGQAEAYKPRAACYRDQRRVRKTLLEHDHFITVLFCGIGTDIPSAKKFFHRVIEHKDARNKFPNYPAG